MEIRLFGGEIAHVDDADASLVAEFQWRAAYTYYRGRRRLSAVVARQRGDDRSVIFMHRLITRPPEGFEVDHIDRDPLNNQRANLRVCSHAENMRNRGRFANNVSGMKGVYPSQGRWRAQIRFNGQKIHLGYFDSPSLAHAAYAQASDRLHGEFGVAA